ncbi:hypothetical protein NESM_000543200 [Novymonas esmeraldas]|uniref:Uncharacterized protein n=1 Tax=Novymonas esmeraldas TaxID=1808958 RepID=A0AAW0EPX0_9TRYP
MTSVTPGGTHLRTEDHGGNGGGVAHHRRHSLHALELVLPLALWSDSFVQARARADRPPSSPPSPCPSVPLQSTSAADRAGSVVAPPRLRQPQATQRTAPAYRRQSPASASTALWRETAHLGGKRVREEIDVTPPSPQPRCTAAAVCSEPAGSCTAAVELDTDGHSCLGLSSSVSRPSASDSRSGSVGSSNSNNSSSSSSGVVVLAPPAASVAATRCTSAHAEALLVFEQLLRRVSAAHATRCPLCSPSQPPHWERSNPVSGPDRSAAALETCWTRAVLCDDAAPATPDARRLHLLQCARVLLEHHDARLRVLSETKPASSKASVSSHALTVACAQVGGLSLLRALAATL